MSYGPLATPNIGNAGAEYAQEVPDAVNKSGIPMKSEIYTSAAPAVLTGVKGLVDYGESRVLKSEAEDLSQDIDQQIEQGFQQDTPAQASVQTLGGLKSAVNQGQMSISSYLIRASALKDRAKGLSPIYGAEIDEVFAKNGIDPSGRNSLGLQKYNFEMEEAQGQIKQVQTWFRDPKMSQYIVFDDGVEQTENNVNVKATLDNVYKINKALTETAQGSFSAINSTFSAINSQLSNSLSQLQQSGGDAGSIAAKQQAVIAQGQNQFKQLISYAIEQQSKFPPGSDQWNAVNAQIANIRSAENDFKTVDPQSLIQLQTTAKMVASQTSIVSGNDEVNYIQSGMKGLERLGQLNATGIIAIDAAGFDVINQKLINNQPLNPIEQTVYTYAKNQPQFVDFLNNNLQKQNYSDMEPAAQNIAAQTDNNSANSFMSYVNGTLKLASSPAQASQENYVSPSDIKQLASNVARLWNGQANSGMFSGDSNNYTVTLSNTSNPQFTSSILKELPPEQRPIAARNAVNIAYTAITASGFPYSTSSLSKNGTRIVLDVRTDSIYFETPQRDIRSSEQYLGTRGSEIADAGNATINNSGAQLWNNALQTMQNLSSYDPALKGKSKLEIAQIVLNEYGYPSNLITVKR